MKQNDFYEVNGCTEFIPVTINETYADGVDVIVHSTTHPFRMAVKQVYQLPKQHEPQKVVVPEFIDSFIRYAKAEDMSLFIAMDNAQNKESEWIIKNEETFARAWLDGYEVEQERLYTVEFPTGQQLYKNHPNGSNKVAIVIKFAPRAEKDGHFTKRELEDAGFGWVFDCDGVKVVGVSDY